MSASLIFLDTINFIEDHLTDFYGFKKHSTVTNHLISRIELESLLGENANSHPEYNSRAGVWFSQEDDFFIGLTFSPSLIESIEKFDPSVSLQQNNLDAFCILIEEISHFHLILNRASTNSVISKLELEAQGEIDKLLISNLLLLSQTGKSHMAALSRVLYDNSQIISEEKNRYELATKFAARFWNQCIEERTEIEEIQRQLKENYRTPWGTNQRVA